jgi:hypothetical protein
MNINEWEILKKYTNELAKSISSEKYSEESQSSRVTILCDFAFLFAELMKQTSNYLKLKGF